MTVVVETGIGLEEANSYIDGAYLVGYFSAERIEKWEKLSQEAQDSLLVSATQFIDLSYRWIGIRKSIEQGLNWPRENAYYPDTETLIDGIPRAVRKATAETVALLLSGNAPASLFMVIQEAQVKREKLAVLETEYFEKKGAAEGETAYEILNLLLAGLYNEDLRKSCGIQTAEVIRS